MAVYPDRIILKNTTDPDGVIRTAIESGGTDEIQQGELVIGRGNGEVALYTVDANGAIQTVSGGGGAKYIEDLLDATYNRSSFSTGYETDELQGDVWGGAAIDATEPRTGTYALTSSGEGLGWTGGIELDRSKRYDFWSFYFRSASSQGTSQYGIPLGGNQTTYRNGENGYTLWMNNTTVYINGSTTTDVALTAAAAPVWTANTYHHVLVQIDWGAAADRTAIPTVSVWLNGAIIVNSSVANSLVWAPLDPTDKEYIKFPDQTVSYWLAFRKSIDDFQQGQRDTPIVSMAEATIVPATVDTAIRNIGVQDGQALVWDNVTRLWVPGNAVGGGGGGLAYWGGGDFDTGISDGEPADGGSFD